MMKHAFTSLIALGALAVASAANAAPAADTSVSLGQNLAGEVCRAESVVSAVRPLDIFCGMSTTPTGRLQISTLLANLPQDATQRRDAVLTRSRAVVANLSVSEQMTCDGGQFLANAGGNDSVLYLCTLSSNSWPRIVVLSGNGRSFYQAEGLPGMLAVLQVAIARASGRQVADAETQAGQRLLEMRLPATILRSSDSDFSNYRQFVQLGRLYSSNNNFAGAEAAYRSALDIETRLFGPDSTAVGYALIELALQVSNQRRFDEAANLFRRATPIINAATSMGVRARLLTYLALDAANQRHFTDALLYARDATAARRAELAEANGSANGGALPGVPVMSSGGLASTLMVEAQMDMRLDDLAGAQAAAEEALLTVSLEPGLPLWWRADIVALMAQINERQGRVTVAERNFLDAVTLDQRLFGDTAPTALMHLKIGRFYTDQQIYPSALTEFRAAMAILTKDPVARAQITSDQIVPFVAAVTAMPAGPQQRAMLNAEIFRASQLANSDVADQTIARASARLAAGNPQLSDLVRQAQDAQRQRDNARIDLAAEFAKPDDERSAARETYLTNTMMVAATQADELLARVQQTFPDYTRLASPGPAELADVQAQLKPGEALLSFVVGTQQSYALLVTPRGLTSHRLDVTTDSLAADTADLRRAFVPQLGSLPAFSLTNAYALYQRLLGPLAGDLMGVDHLIVAPGADLASLPFALLVAQMPANGTTYSNAAWLIGRMALSQVPSPRSFLALKAAEQARVAPPRPFLGLGDPLYTGALARAGEPNGGRALDALALGCREAGPIPPETLRALPPLHDTAQEVNDVARALGGTADSVLLGANATEANFRARPLDEYGVLYIASHGLLPGELHCQAEPGLALSPPAAATSAAQDGLLDASEIAQLKLNADLVVLSACNTAAAGGGRFGGGALEGLADAFFNAGARAVLASHWEVPSAATARLMTGIFQRYGQNRMRGLAEALRQSQLALIAAPQSAHPFNWAAFTLIGDSGTTQVAANAPPVMRQATDGDRP